MMLTKDKKWSQNPKIILNIYCSTELENAYFPVKYKNIILIIYKCDLVIYISKVSYGSIWINNFYLPILHVTIIYKYILILVNHL